VASRIAIDLVTAGLVEGTPPLAPGIELVTRSAAASRAAGVASDLLSEGQERAAAIVAAHPELVVAVAGHLEREAVRGPLAKKRVPLVRIAPEPLRALLATGVGQTTGDGRGDAGPRVAARGNGPMPVLARRGEALMPRPVPLPGDRGAGHGTRGRALPAGRPEATRRAPGGEW
jgi:hypothetical protein